MSTDLDKLIEELMQGVHEIKPGGKAALKELFQEAAKEKRQLRVKLGIDPTSSDLHLGHMVCIQKLRQFQEAGHKAVLLIGGYTAQVGDPSGRNEARPPLSKEDVAVYAQTYLDQVKRVLDLSTVELVNNADWFDKFSMTDMVRLASRVSVNQMIAKDAFGKRLDEGNPLYIHEILYPLLMAYDSYEVKADIELGGTDQTFNLMVGRDMQRAYNQKPQLALTMPLLVGLDGVKKMSKTSQNYIALNDSPTEMFGKTMSIPDDLILNYYILAARASIAEIEEVKAKLANPEKFNPRDLKIELGKKIVAIYHSTQDADAAAEQFINQFRNKEIPDDIPEYSLLSPARLIDLIADAKMVDSKADAKRLVAGGGVKLDGNKLDDPFQEISHETDLGKVLQVGKRKFIKLVRQ